MKNIIAFSRLSIVKGKKNNWNREEKATVMAELANFGYILPKKAADYIDLEWYNDITTHIRNSIGDNYNYRALYPNFPKQVMDMSYIELFFNAIFHYATNGKWEPCLNVSENKQIKQEKENLKTISLITEEEFLDIFKNIVSLNQSIPYVDKEAIAWFVKNYNNLPIPEDIPFKETLCILAAYGLDVPINNTNDVLRIATYMSCGETEITKHVRFRSFKNKERKYLVSLLEKSPLNLDDAKKYETLWKKFGKHIHVSQYKSFKKTIKFFNLVRNELNNHVSFNSKVEKAIKDKEFPLASELLKKRPGEFARRIDALVRKSKSTDILSDFVEVSDKVSTKVLYELYSHFSNRNDASIGRYVTVNGIKKELPLLEPLDTTIIDAALNSIKMALGKKFKQRPNMGNVYIDKKLKKIPLPIDMRSLNTSIHTLIRGTRIKLPTDTNVVRGYLHWFDEMGNIDLDLSAILFDKDFNKLSHISYTNLRDLNYDAVHSGDIRHRKGACAEYVDISLDSFENGVRYVLFGAYHFNKMPLHTAKSVFGIQSRQYPESNLNFIPSTIEAAINISNDNYCVYPCVFDLKTKEMIWLDIDGGNSINIESSSNSFKMIKNAILSNTLSVYDILYLNASNRGEVVTKDKADLKFEYGDILNSYEKISPYY